MITGGDQVNFPISLTLIAFALFCIPSAVAAVLTVSPSTANASIQDAVNAANPGDTIQVLSGTYNENVVVTKPLYLIGVGLPVVDAGGNGSAVTLSSNESYLEGFKVVNAGADSGGILVITDGCTIRGNTAMDNVIGIMVENAGNNTIIENMASNNRNDGIELYNFSNNNTLMNNYAIGNSWNGVYLSASQDNILISNACNNNQENGIYLENSGENGISANSASHNGWNGIYLSRSYDNALMVNTCNNNRQNGIDLFNSYNNNLTANYAGHNRFYGVFLSGSSGNTMAVNTLKGNAINNTIFSPEFVAYSAFPTIGPSGFFGIPLTHVTVSSNPPGADLFLDGRKVATTPFPLPFRSSGVHSIELRKPGYRSYRDSLSVPGPKQKVANLERA